MRYKTIIRYLEAYKQATVQVALADTLPQQEQEILLREYDAANKSLRYVLRMLSSEPNDPTKLEKLP